MWDFPLASTSALFLVTVAILSANYVAYLVGKKSFTKGEPEKIVQTMCTHPQFHVDCWLNGWYVLMMWFVVCIFGLLVIYAGIRVVNGIAHVVDASCFRYDNGYWEHNLSSEYWGNYNRTRERELYAHPPEILELMLWCNENNWGTNLVYNLVDDVKAKECGTWFIEIHGGGTTYAWEKPGSGSRGCDIVHNCKWNQYPPFEYLSNEAWSRCLRQGYCLSSVIVGKSNAYEDKDQLWVEQSL